MSSRSLSARTITVGSLCVALNLVLSTVVAYLSIPLIFLDTVGTVAAGAALGPWGGALVGVASNLLKTVIRDPAGWPFALVNLMIGVTAGFVARRWGFGFKPALITGLVLAVVAPLVGTPIAMVMYQGLGDGGGLNLLISGFRALGMTAFWAAFWPRVATNLVDKVVTCLLVSYAWKRGLLRR